MTRVVAWLLLAACLVLSGAWFVVSEQQTPYRALRAAVADGEVDEVTVYGSTAPFRGRLQVEVRWRTGPFGAFRHVATVTEQHPLRENLWRAQPFVEDAGEDLTALDPDLVVERRNDRPGSVSSEAFGRTVPWWFVMSGLLVGLGCLVLLIGGQPPWRATRWAWFWILGLTPPVGPIAFLLLSGRTGRWPPQRPDQKLTGGWAFLLVFVVNSAVQTIMNAALV